MQTSQAVDVIQGGVKVNALPERTVVTVNHRINIGSKPEDVWNHVKRLVAPIAKKHGLALHAFNSTEEAPNAITLSASKTTLRVAPITPTEVDGQTPYSILSGTIRALYGGNQIIVKTYAYILQTAPHESEYVFSMSSSLDNCSVCGGFLPSATTPTLPNPCVASAIFRCHVSHLIRAKNFLPSDRRLSHLAAFYLGAYDKRVWPLRRK